MLLEKSWSVCLDVFHALLVGKARSLSIERSTIRCSTQVGSSFTCKYEPCIEPCIKNFPGTNPPDYFVLASLTKSEDLITWTIGGIPLIFL
jgi:hypothetical protein